VMSFKEKNSGEGSFCMAFQRPIDAIQWSMAAQKELLEADWPQALLEHLDAAEEWGNDDQVIFRGLRVRMGIHYGSPRMMQDALTRKVEFFGPVVNAAARITSVAYGGQILLSQAIYDKVKDKELAKEKNRLRCLGLFDMPDSLTNRQSKLWELRTPGLEGRFFGGLFNANREKVRSSSSSGGDGDDDDDQDVPTELVAFTHNEDMFLTSANLCRWVIDFNEIQLGNQLGMGSYGVVYKGRWKGVDVAVKKFVKQKLDESHMLEFRAEMAFLSECHHPNIILFIGACMKRPNLCLVTEFVKQGSLADLLLNTSVRMPWLMRMRMLRSAALGIYYLHSLSPCILHRDLKPSNLLVDENWNVKVADFGFARIKEENATMTRCGTPSWTAPEVIRGEKYSEKADIYSFGMIMWQTAARKQPFAGRNFMGVSLDVLEGKRPQLPVECPEAFAKLVKKCWHAKQEKRPTMEEVLVAINQLVGDQGIDVSSSSSLILVTALLAVRLTA